jgi:hypothetical protein
MEAAGRTEEGYSGGVEPVAGGRLRRRRGCPRRLGASPADSFGQEMEEDKAVLMACSSGLGDGRSCGEKRRPAS